MTTLQKTIVATALLAAVGVGVYSLHQGSQLRAQIKTLEQERAPLAARVQQLESDRVQGSNLVAALRDENARLKSARTEGELLKLRGEVGSLRQRALSSEAKAKQPTGLAGMMNDPAMRDYMRKAMKDKMKSMYADYIKERNLTPEQSEQFLELLSDAASAKMAQLTAAALGTQAPPDASRDITSQLGALLGADGGARLKDYSEEMPGKATLGLVNEELPNAPLTPEQGAKLVQVIKSEPSQLTQGILGSPDQAFLGSQADIDTFLQQVAESNQRILQQAGNFLDPNQLAALNTVLTKGIESRKLQGAAFFHKP